MKRSFVTRIVVGMFLLAVGVALLGSLAGFWDFGRLADDWWALLVIVPAVAGITATGFHFWNVSVLLLGVWLLANSQGWFAGNGWPYLVGGLLVLVGVRIILGAVRRHHPEPERTPPGDGDNRPRWTAAFAASVRRSRSVAFQGGRFRGVLGSLTVDLREIAPAEHAVVKVTAVLGGVTLLMPRDMPLKVSVTPVFGTVVNLLPPQAVDAESPALEIKGSVLFGVVQLI